MGGWGGGGDDVYGSATAKCREEKTGLELPRVINAQ